MKTFFFHRYNVAALALAIAVILAVAGAPIGIAAAAPVVVLGDTMLDIFRDDAFGVINLTDAINKIPFVPGRAGRVVPWGNDQVTTTTILIEEFEGQIAIVNPSARGGPGSAVGKEKRTMRSLIVPHYQRDDGIQADEVQGVREFGTTNAVQTLQSRISARMARHTQDMDVTLEYQRLGALKGVILNGDSTTLLDLFSAFGVSQEAEIAFDLGNASPARGVFRKACAGVVRKIADNLAGTPYTGVWALCGDAFFDDLLAHKEVVDSYLNTNMATVLRSGYLDPSGNLVYGVFEFGGIVWENYRGSVGGSAFVNTDKCHIFPVGVPGLYKTVYAPADYIETVNTPGLPRYAKQFPMPNDKGINLEMQMNTLNYCTRPKVLIKGKRQA